MLFSLPYDHQEDSKKFYWSLWEKIGPAGVAGGPASQSGDRSGADH